MNDRDIQIVTQMVREVVEVVLEQQLTKIYNRLDDIDNRFVEIPALYDKINDHLASIDKSLVEETKS